jgi:hypothetical protein
VVPFMSQITRWPLTVFCQRMSALPSPLKSPEPAMLHDVYRSQTDKGLKRGAIHERDNALASKLFCQRMSALPSPLKSPEPAMLHDGSTVPKLTKD